MHAMSVERVYGGVFLNKKICFVIVISAVYPFSLSIANILYVYIVYKQPTSGEWKMFSSHEKICATFSNDLWKDCKNPDL